LGASTISKSIDVTSGAANTCHTGTTVTIDAANGNNNLWVPITGPDGNIMAEINANGNNLGVVTSSFYKNSNALRVRGGVYYLDRNITITPQFQPTLPSGNPLVKVRLYISKAEFDVLDAHPASGISGITGLKILKNNDGCVANASGATTLITPTNTILTDLEHGTNGYVLQANINSFSSFYFASNNMTLPLDLLTFTGSLQSDKSTLLKWKTENEVNTSHFVVERSVDAVTFSSIGTVAAAGNSTNVQDYSLTDNGIANQQSLIFYYRLKMVDIDGQFKYSNVIAITLADITGAISIAPNPVANEAKVTVTAPEDGKLNFKVVDNAGRTILQRTLQVRKGIANTIYIDMQNLSAGMYFLNVTGAGLNKNLKVQKQ
jgi:trimeric autotransporter adhesin